MWDNIIVTHYWELKLISEKLVSSKWFSLSWSFKISNSVFNFLFCFISDTHFSTVALWAMFMWLSILPEWAFYWTTITRGFCLLMLKVDSCSSSLGTGLMRVFTLPLPWRNLENVLCTWESSPQIPQDTSDHWPTEFARAIIQNLGVCCSFAIRHSERLPHIHTSDSHIHSDQHVNNTPWKP